MPTDLTATAVSGTQVDLSWTDQAWDETGFRIERMAGPFGSFRQIAVLGVDANSYSDKSVNPATTYYYRVCAFGNDGYSDYSNEAWALTNGMDFTEILRGNTTRKQMALTFDCGQTPILPGLLQILRERQVYATFFVTGRVAEQVPGSVLEIVADGHVIGNHTYNHPNLTTIPDEEVVSQLQRADDIIYGIAGHRTRPFFRPPSGQRDARVLAAAQSAGFRSVCWTAGGGDFGGWTTQQIIDDTFANAKNGGVMLYHASVANTEAALPTIIDGLRAQGYELVTVPEIVAPDVI
ncbi:MAG: polysaccharide deacetylase family protein, partial [Armatimonadetes bacterium]|nr:polysaccharide deacetylase family protein [Armatimonadota bacterium]